VCSVDNRHDAAFASSQTGRKRLARAIAAGIQAVRRLERSTSSPSRNDRIDR
jgi:N-acetylmuramoyl-L-alanine amidase